mmetsp:Transcript_19430/g.29866  ORF Transcript_19430/g.29866 Transcript_19430/m.29866 type:complete len:154 (+) Transcript_19430:1-462(+)
MKLTYPATLCLLLFSASLSQDQFAQAVKIKSFNQIHDVVDPKKMDDSHFEILMEKKRTDLQQRVAEDSQKVQTLEQKLTDAKIDLETDQTMLLRHQEVVAAEKHSIEALDKQVGARAQAVDKASIRQEKHKKLKAAAERLVQKEERVRANIQE